MLLLLYFNFEKKDSEDATLITGVSGFLNNATMSGYSPAMGPPPFTCNKVISLKATDKILLNRLVSIQIRFSSFF